MADVVTTTSAVTLVQQAWERRAYFALRPRLFFDQIATVQPVAQSMPGSSVTFTIMSDLPVQTSALNEVTDVSAIAMSDNTVPVTLLEYGAAVMTTAKLRSLAFVPVNPIVANVLGFNAGLSLDSIARNVVFASGNQDYVYGSGYSAITSVATTSKMTANTIRNERLQLIRNFVMPFDQELYTAYIHPDVLFDLRTETGAGSWRQPHEFLAGTEIWNGQTGIFEGFRFIESPRVPYTVGAGAGAPAATVYETAFTGQEGLAKAWSKDEGNGPIPRIFPGPITDHLRRLAPVGWYWLGGFGLFRAPSIRLVASAASNNAQS